MWEHHDFHLSFSLAREGLKLLKRPLLDILKETKYKVSKYIPFDKRSLMFFSN